MIFNKFYKFTRKDSRKKNLVFYFLGKCIVIFSKKKKVFQKKNIGKSVWQSFQICNVVFFLLQITFGKWNHWNSYYYLIRFYCYSVTSHCLRTIVPVCEKHRAKRIKFCHLSWLVNNGNICAGCCQINVMKIYGVKCKTHTACWIICVKIIKVNRLCLCIVHVTFKKLTKWLALLDQGKSLSPVRLGHININIQKTQSPTNERNRTRKNETLSSIYVSISVRNTLICVPFCS